jgi:hypothetical protein
MTKAAKNRLLKSEFFHEVEAIVDAWDYYLVVGDQASANEMASKWFTIKPALEYITGKPYSFSRKNGIYSIVNDLDHNDRLLVAYSKTKEEVAA